MFRFSQRLRSILKDQPESVLGELDHYDIEIEDALTGGGWSPAVSWTPKLAALDYDTSSWVEPNYGNAAHASAPALQYGLYRTNGVAVAAWGLIVIGKGGADDTAPVAVASDGIMYLSLPLPNADGFPLLADQTFNNQIPVAYSVGGFPLGSLNGNATFGSYSDEMANGGLIMPPWSETYASQTFPADPPADMASWCSATTWDAANTKSVWAWGGGTIASKSPQPYPDAGWSDGLMISWNVHYFTTATN